MKNCLILLLFVSSISSGQSSTSFAVFGGANFSKFGIPGYTETSSMPVGGSLQYGGVLKGGFEYSTNELMPYKYKAFETSSSTSPVYTQSIVEQNVSFIATLDFVPDGGFAPYLSGGVGAYFGKLERENVSPTSKTSSKFEPAFGWYGAFGFNIRLGESPRFFVEGRYTKFKWELEDDSFRFESKSIGIRSGFRFIF